MTRAIIFVKSEEFEPHAARCMQRLEESGYQFQGLVQDDWSAAQQMIDNGETSVVIVSDEKHLPPNRKPRIEIVSHPTNSGRWDKRTKIIRRGEAE